MDELSNPVMRFDFVEMSHQPTVTSQGFLRLPARFTRTGIFTYVNYDPVTGKNIESKEYRPPDEVFNKESLSTIANSPLTNGHPNIHGQETTVTPDNFKQLSVGWVGPELRQDGDYVAGTLTVADKNAIDSVNAGLLKELSVGYVCQLEKTPGIINGQRYDAIQRNITGNHVALLPAGQGRAGAQCALRLDSKDAVLSGIHTMGDEMEPEVSKVEVNEPTESPVDKNFNQLLDLQAKVDSLTSELEIAREDAKKAKEAAPTPGAVVDANTLQLANLLHGAKDILGDSFDFTGMNASEIKLAVLGQVAPQSDFSGKSEDYINGFYDSCISAADSGGADMPENQMGEPSMSGQDSMHKTMKGDSLAQANALALSACLGVKKNDAVSSREEMHNRNRNAWKEDLTFSKSKLFASQN